jgi:hypothetical protein
VKLALSFKPASPLGPAAPGTSGETASATAPASKVGDAKAVDEPAASSSAAAAAATTSSAASTTASSSAASTDKSAQSAPTPAKSTAVLPSSVKSSHKFSGAGTLIVGVKEARGLAAKDGDTSDPFVEGFFERKYIYTRLCLVSLVADALNL